MSRDAWYRWRLAWLAAGLVGLVVLTLLPGRRPPQPAAQAGANSAAVPLEALWQPDPGAVALWLEAGGDAGAILDPIGSRPLHLLLSGPGCAAGDPAVAQVLEALLDAGAGVDALDRRGNSPLLLGASRCPEPVIARLLEAGADPGRSNLAGLTALEIAVTAANPGTTALLDAGVRMTPEQVGHYRRIYADEPGILAWVERAAP